MTDYNDPNQPGTDAFNQKLAEAMAEDVEMEMSVREPKPPEISALLLELEQTRNNLSAERRNELERKPLCTKHVSALYRAKQSVINASLELDRAYTMSEVCMVCGTHYTHGCNH